MITGLKFLLTLLSFLLILHEFDDKVRTGETIGLFILGVRNSNLTLFHNVCSNILPITSTLNC